LTKWLEFLQNASGNPSYHRDLLPSRLEYAFCKCSGKLLTNHHVRKVSQRQKKSDKRSKQQNHYRSLQNGDISHRNSLLPTKAEKSLPWGFSLRVATLTSNHMSTVACELLFSQRGVTDCL